MQVIPISDTTTIPKTVREIRKLAMAGRNYPEVLNITEVVRSSPDPLKTLFDIAYDVMVYEREDSSTQSLRTMKNIFQYGKGNCVHYSTLISSVLMNLGIPHYYDVVSYDKPNEYNHIFIQVGNTILDPVPGHRQDGTDTRTNRPKQGKYNYTEPYKYIIRFYMPKLQILNGTEPLSGSTVTSRSRRVRMTNTYGSLGCSCGDFQSHLGKTVFGKIFQGVGDVVKGVGNVLVTPFEGILNKQIINNNYSDTGLGNFIKKSDQNLSKLNVGIGNVVTSIFTGGLIKVKDANATEAAKDQQVKDIKSALDMAKASVQSGSSLITIPPRKFVSRNFWSRTSLKDQLGADTLSISEMKEIIPGGIIDPSKIDHSIQKAKDLSTSFDLVKLTSDIQAILKQKGLPTDVDPGKLQHAVSQAGKKGMTYEELLNAITNKI